jgi:hypothetical protein
LSKFTKEEISAILRAAEVLKKKESSEKINVSRFCKEAGISRKNAYKHKKKINISVDSLEEKNRELEHERARLHEKLKSAEQRAREADLFWECRNILVALNNDIKKNGPGRTPERQKLTERYNSIMISLGKKPHNFWD